jgi:hypothetical protein
MKSFRKNRKTRKTRRRKQFGGGDLIQCTNCKYVYNSDKCTKGWFRGLSCICPRCQSTNYTKYKPDSAPTGMLSNNSGLSSGEAWSKSQGTPQARTVSVLPPVATRLSGNVSALPVASVTALPVANATPRY